MPHITTPDGETKYIPGVYNTQRVVSGLPGPLPEFHIPVILGQAFEGHPYNAQAAQYDHEAPFTPFKPVGTASAAASYFGKDAELTIGFEWAKRHGAPFAYAGCMGALTRASVVVRSTGPVAQFTLYGKKFGAPTNHVKVRAPSGTSIQVTPLKYFSQLIVSAVSADKRVYVRDNSWIRPGQALQIGANDATTTEMTVLATGVSYTSTGKKRYYVDFTAAVGDDFATSQYAMLWEWDEDRKEISPTFGTCQEMIDWLNSGSSKTLGAKKETSTFTNPAAIVSLGSATELQDISAWGAVTKGTSPAPTSADYTAFVTLMLATGWQQFLLEYGVIPQAFCMLEQGSTAQGTMRDWAIEMRAQGYAVSMIAGCDWGDVVIGAGDDTDPTFRSAALNSQDFGLAAGGLDRQPAYLSLAPAIWGRRVGGGVGHNLTNDELFYSELEAMWDEINSGELTALLRAGVLTYKLSVGQTIRFRVAQGLSTLQNNASSWNVVTRDTCLLMQRDIADFVDRVIKTDLETDQIGADEVTPTSIAATILRRSQRSLMKRKLIKRFSISTIELNDSGAGFDVDWNISLRDTNDYINVTTNIQIGEA